MIGALAKAPGARSNLIVGEVLQIGAESIDVGQRRVVDAEVQNDRGTLKTCEALTPSDPVP
jgi:hypothetical protein